MDDTEIGGEDSIDSIPRPLYESLTDDFEKQQPPPKSSHSKRLKISPLSMKILTQPGTVPTIAPVNMLKNKFFKSTNSTPTKKIKINEPKSTNIINTNAAIMIKHPTANSTPRSREIVALQRSVTESKVLTEFVSDGITLNTRKSRTVAGDKIQQQNDVPMSYDDVEGEKSSLKQCKSSIVNQILIPSKDGSAMTRSADSFMPGNMKLTLRKVNRSKSISTLSDDAERLVTGPRKHSLLTTALNKANRIRNHERSRSFVYSDDSANIIRDDAFFEPTSFISTLNKKMSLHKDDSSSSCSSNAKNRLRRKSEKSPPLQRMWASEERISKRSNMRSENSDFVQKQVDFLNRVIYDTENDAELESTKGNTNSDSVTESNSSINVIATASEATTTSTAATELQPTEFIVLDSSGEINSTTFYSDIGADDESNTLNNTTGLSSPGISHSLINDAAAEELEGKLKEIWRPPPKEGWDPFCWKCRKCDKLIPCSKCLRCYHKLCIKAPASTKLDKSWICPECMTVENILNGQKRTRRNDLSLDLLSQLLSFALNRMRNVKGLTKVFAPQEVLPNSYKKYIVNPVTFKTLEEKINNKGFRCAEEFVNETKWMHHNALILNILFVGNNNKMTHPAKAIVKVCRQESNEIDTCAECYLNANTRVDWFVDVCTQPHLLLWAKLKGFPYWPAKAMGLGQSSLVNVRFFGEHDRAFVPLKDCFLYSIQDPNTQTGRRSARELADCRKEVELHIEKIKAKIGDFKYAKYKTPYEPAEEHLQLEEMMPGVHEYMKRQQTPASTKVSLQYLIVKTADNNNSFSIIKKTSTPESGNDSDHSNSPVKRKLPEPASVVTDCSEQKKLLESQQDDDANMTPKYEIVPKETNDEHRVCAVILKRKSIGIHRESLEIKTNTTNTKIVRNTVDPKDAIHVDVRKHTQHPTTTNPLKRKHAALESLFAEETTTTTTSPSSTASTEKSNNGKIVVVEEKQRTKISKHEARSDSSIPKVPVMTIKTITTKVDHAAQVAAVEKLVKHKQGVTIKKITKDSINFIYSNTERTKLGESMQQPADETRTMEKKQLSEKSMKSQHHDEQRDSQQEIQPHKSTNIGSTNQTDQVQPPQCLQRSKVTSSALANENIQPQLLEQQHSELEKQPQDVQTESATENSNERVTNIIKELVPFIEIKTEALSDIEDDEEQITAGSTTGNKNNGDIIISDSSHQSIELTESTAIEKQQPQLLLIPAEIKQEVLSDDEQQQQQTLLEEFISNNALEQQQATQKNNVLQNDEATCKVQVGLTTIQRLSTRQQSATTTTIITSAATATVNVSPTSTNLTTTPASRRFGLRGVPYGPLPAAAAAAAATSNAILPDAAAHATGSAEAAPGSKSSVTLNSGAAESYNGNSNEIASSGISNKQKEDYLEQQSSQTRANRTNKSLINLTTISFNTSTVTTTAVTTTLTTPSLLRTSMVAIPVDVATQRNNNNNNNINGNMPSGSNTTGGNIAVTVGGNVSNNNININTIPVPPLTAVTKQSTGGVNIISSTTRLTESPPVFANMTLSSTNNTIPPPPLAGLTLVTNNTQTSNLTLTPPQPTISLSPAQPPIASIVINNSNEPAATAASASSNDTHLLGDLITPTLASTITDMICRGPPKATPRPHGPLQSDGSNVFPSQAGPVSRSLMENAHKLTDFFISVMEDTMSEMCAGDAGVLQAKVTLLSLEMERMKANYENQLTELRRTSDLMLCEMRKSMENEKRRIASEVRQQCAMERMRSVEETKKKQWCANCGLEAQLYCCWNTSYCDYPCQQQHWTRHAINCAQTARQGSNSKNGSCNDLSIPQQQLQHHPPKQKQDILHRNKTKISLISSTAPTSITPHFNKPINSNSTNSNSNSNVNPGNKKEKISLRNQSLPPPPPPPTMVAIGNSTSSEILRLPTNTYLRPVPVGSVGTTATTSGGAITTRNSTTGNYGKSSISGVSSSSSMQRHNISLPITLNTGPPFTLLQRVVMSNAAATDNSNTVTQQQQQSQTVSSPSMSSLVAATKTGQQIHQQSRHNRQTTSQQKRLSTGNTKSGGRRNASGNKMLTLNSNQYGSSYRNGPI